VNYLYGHDETVAAFAANLIPSCRSRGFGRCKTIGVLDEEGLIIAGLVYHQYDPDAEIIEISAAALPRRYWLTRETLRRMFEYPFLQIGCQMVVQRIEASDERQQRMMAAFDYMLIRVPRMMGRDKDGILCLLTYEDWLGNRFNRRLREQMLETREAAE
jgi:RimJ/RimL family protein N-acetyltransferase